MKITVFALMVTLVSGATVSARADSFGITFEAPAVYNTTAALTYGGVENFNALSSGVQTVNTDFGTGGAITGTYTGVDIAPADLYGGAAVLSGPSAYAIAPYSGNDSTSYTLSLSTTHASGINYFGAYMTAIDIANTVTFYKGNTLVGDFELTSLLPVSVTGNPAYFCNAAFYGNCSVNQPFVFMNFTDTSGTFDKIVFSEPASYQYGANFESDNHTVGFVAGVPEPAAWALMILGFGAVGGWMRRRRAATVPA